MEDGRLRAHLHQESQDSHTNPSQKQAGERSSVKPKRSLSLNLHVITGDYEGYGKKMEDSDSQGSNSTKYPPKGGLPEGRYLSLGKQSNLPRARTW